MHTALPFGRWLKRRRVELRLTQAELARRVEYSIVTIRKIESEELRPSLQIAERLAEHLDIPAEDRADFVRFARGGRDAYFPTRLDQLFDTPYHDLVLGQRPMRPPVSPTTLIGRKQELTDVRDLLLSESTRLVTLTGTGGVGKTSLALEVAKGLSDQFSNGLCFVDLAPVVDVHLVMNAIAAAIGIQERIGTPLLDTMVAYLQQRELLLLLDNFEHLIPAAPVVAQLLAAAPLLRVLVTSREVLRLRGEYTFQVPPLSSPTTYTGLKGGFSAEPTEVEELLRYPAIDLFVARATFARADFALSAHNAAAVVEICTRLEGVPLAIELAAARMRLFTAQDLVDRLDSRLNMLVDGSRDLPARQRTLRATIAWSYDLLDVSEQMLFRRLAVFVGGCSLRAAEAICYLSQDGDHIPAFTAQIESLIDKNLLWRREDARGEVRIGMLETIREYASEQLHESKEAPEIHRLHAEYFLELVETAEPELRGPNQMAHLAELDIEYNNVRAALRYALDSDSSSLALRLVGALRWFWTQRSHISEGYDWAMAALAKSDTSDDAPARAKALWCAGVLAWLRGEAVAATLLADSAAKWRTLGDKRGLAYSLQHLGLVGLWQGDHENVLSLEMESLALFHAEGDRFGQSLALLCMAQVASQSGNSENEGRWLGECVQIARETGDKWVLALALRSLGRKSISRGEFGLARPILEESIRLFSEMGTKHELAATLDDAATVESKLGDNARAAWL